LMGHLLGAAAAAELVIAILQMHNNFLHTMPNLDNLDPQININVVGKKIVETEIRNFMKNSFGFGGHNVSLVVGRYQG
ncbi:MAG TPA: beta-ketoacyl-[acyl-carrier-protein] synthase II, partial [Pseudothermotoga sp.]